MNNGHMSIASIPTAKPITAREAPVAATETTESASKNGSDFARLLSGQQLSAQKGTPAESEQTEQSDAEVRSTTTFIDVASQLVLAACLQPGISAAEINQIALPVDMQQNATMTTEPSAVLTDPAAPIALLPDDRLQNAAMSTEAVIAQKLQQPEVTRTAVGNGLSTKTESATAPSMAASPALPVEVAYEIQHPDPLQNPAAVAATPAAADKLLNEMHTIRPRHGSEPQTEKNVDVRAFKGAASPEMDAVDCSLIAGSVSPGDSEGESDAADDNPDMRQNMPGQLAVEQQKATTAATRPSVGEPLRQNVSEQVMPQVKERLEMHDIKPGKQQITLTLSPGTLGELKMNLNLQGDKLSIEIVTENRSVRDAIVQHVDTLKESLARQNITMESFDVTTGGKGSGNQGQNQNAWRELVKQQQQQQQFWTSPRGYATAQADSLSGVAMQQRLQGQSMLDIHY
jgi:flagellar hook-length control protein FliK